MQIHKIYTMILLAGFLLGIHNGKIALWKSDDPKPVHIFPFRVNMLPIDDQLALKKGIIINNEKDLNQLLEDYLS